MDEVLEMTPEYGLLFLKRAKLLEKEKAEMIAYTLLATIGQALGGDTGKDKSQRPPAKVTRHGHGPMMP